jgi:hypothetical protein
MHQGVPVSTCERAIPNLGGIPSEFLRPLRLPLLYNTISFLAISFFDHLPFVTTLLYTGVFHFGLLRASAGFHTGISAVGAPGHYRSFGRAGLALSRRLLLVMDIVIGVQWVV